MIHFVGAGPGAPDLITLRGAELLKQADVCIYAGSLVNPVLLGLCREDCAIYNSAEMTLEEVLAVMERAEAQGKQTVRLHTGDPCLYGAIREQMDALNSKGISYAITPGVSSFCGAAAAAEAEYTLPGVSQTVIITRMAGRTPVPEREGIASLAAHGATYCKGLTRNRPRRRWSTRPPGRRKRSSGALWENWRKRGKNTAFPRRPWSWSAVFWGRTMSAAASTLRISPRSFGGRQHDLGLCRLHPAGGGPGPAFGAAVRRKRDEN